MNNPLMAFVTFVPLRNSLGGNGPDTALVTTTHRHHLPTALRLSRKSLLVPNFRMHTGEVAQSPQSLDTGNQLSKRITTIPAPSEVLFTVASFASLGLESSIVHTLQAMHIEQPTTIQSRGIPAILGGGDVILGAATGSGKTLAYLLPVVQALKNAEALRTSSDPPLRLRRRPRALILVPTRELADQVLAVGRALAHGVKFRIASAIGGTSEATKKLNERLDQPIDVLVATTGRLLQLVRARTIDIRFASHVVIDEVDTMFDKNFGPEVRAILSAVSAQVPDDEQGTFSRAQLVAAGATHPPAAVAIYQEAFLNPTRIHVDLHLAPAGLEQRFVRVRADEKLPELPSLVRDDEASRTGVMVFCNTVESCRFVHHYLTEIGIQAICVHGEMPAVLREREYARFAAMDGLSERAVLVCTDVTGRGVDHAKVGHVVLFDFPVSAVDYVHRAGRTARAGAKGRVTSLVTKKDEQLARALERAGRGRADALESERHARDAAEEREKKEREAERERERLASVDSPVAGNVKHARRPTGKAYPQGRPHARPKRFGSTSRSGRRQSTRGR